MPQSNELMKARSALGDGNLVMALTNPRSIDGALDASLGGVGLAMQMHTHSPEEGHFKYC
ncbi:hypothetical protein [Chromohalobacter sp. 296-RDG]|uniref:hypothetical protein n=1 Tax=Chromohalobacter sp. 296-RDG TaxID=2994062 RepID=UPI0024689080|nr:hypothetical protein [Chromohalobacter sp. 296-RDG]